MTETEKLGFWRQGIEHFNERRFWHAHESWERGWLELPEAEKLHVQSLIQLCGVFDLVGRGRPGAALSLTKLALEKLSKLEKLGGIDAIYPRIEVAGIANALETLKEMLAHTSETELVRAISGISLKAELLLSPQ